MQKVRGHAVLLRAHSAPTACRLTVSGSVSLPSRGSFHLSLTVLSSLSVAKEYLALGGGPPKFPTDSTCPVVLGILPGDQIFSPTGLSPSLAGLSRPFG